MQPEVLRKEKRNAVSYSNTLNPKVSASPLPNASGNKNTSKEIQPASEPETKEIKTEAKSSLSGERIHGLPNETLITHNAMPAHGVISDSKIARILDKIKSINEEQSIRNEDIFGPVNNATVIIAIQVHNRLQYLRQLVISLSQGIVIACSILLLFQVKEFQVFHDLTKW